MTFIENRNKELLKTPLKHFHMPDCHLLESGIFFYVVNAPRIVAGEAIGVPPLHLRNV